MTTMEEGAIGRTYYSKEHDVGFEFGRRFREIHILGWGSHFYLSFDRVPSDERPNVCRYHAILVSTP